MTGSWSRTPPTKDGFYFYCEAIGSPTRIAEVGSYGEMGCAAWFLGERLEIDTRSDCLRGYLWWSEPIPVPPRPEAM
jgi:hypothetical protein